MLGQRTCVSGYSASFRTQSEFWGLMENHSFIMPEQPPPSIGKHLFVYLRFGLGALGHHFLDFQRVKMRAKMVGGKKSAQECLDDRGNRPLRRFFRSKAHFGLNKLVPNIFSLN